MESPLKASSKNVITASNMENRLKLRDKKDYYVNLKVIRT